MRSFFKNLAALCCASCILLLLAFIMGLTPGALLDGHWTAVNDHPTNWDDLALHPNQ